MGLAASQARFLGLVARKSDKEYQGQQINQARTQLADKTDSLFQSLLTLKVPNAANDPVLYDSETDAPLNDSDGDGLSNAYEADLTAYSLGYQTVNVEVEKLHLEDRGLETRLKAVDSEHQQIQTEVDAVKKVIDKNIETTFKTFG
ncbi:MAG: hypothetical protein PHC34_03680 [Candidatus Gastranaerophilales bacterium]|nr:hypothetical protein [Candidatus Gastranaerophilales bacterium]